jgi:hypothetical protein
MLVPAYLKISSSMVVLFRFVFASVIVLDTVFSYANLTLTSLGGELSAVIYLPYGIKPDEDTYYFSSRFDHSSMIGSIKRKVTEIVYRGGIGERMERYHVLFDTGIWRIPHNSNWPESGVGLASEFGVGDDGDFCNYRCGWSGEEGVTNGVLGYREAKLGESFLKIGVGELIKGSCPTCDSTEDYKFNSPYQFAKLPIWHLAQNGPNAITLTHEATLNNHGYRLQKEIELDGKILTATSTLTNLGSDSFSTAWYAHNLFTCDNVAVGPGYSLDLDISGNQDGLYDEPGTWSWSTPLEKFATVQPNPESIHIEMRKALPPGVRIKTEFFNDGETQGSFNLFACKTSLSSKLSQVGQSSLSMYAYNLYIERGTLSPEPQILLHLEPDASISWSQQLEIDAMPADLSSSQHLGMQIPASLVGSSVPTGHVLGSSVLFAVGALIFLVFRRASRSNYIRIPDTI